MSRWGKGLLFWSVLGISVGARRSSCQEAASYALPPEVAERIRDRPERFTELVDALSRLPHDLLLLVDKEHRLSEDFVPENLVSLDDYSSLTLSKSGLRLRRICLPSMIAMTKAMQTEGLTLPISSAYRSYPYQKKVHARALSLLGPRQALRLSAPPGSSQHQLGTTVDFGSISSAFTSSKAGQWLKKNAWQYGFSLSYPEGQEEITGFRHEGWHYRFFTRAGTALEREFFGGSQQKMLLFWRHYSSSGMR